jgi:alpha-mannosidase
VRDGVMRMTVLRSPAYAHHDNGRFNADDAWPIMDQGWQELRFRLVPHGGDWRDARVVKQGWELNAPPVVHCESAHPGSRSAQASLLGTESDNVLLSVIKRSEDGNDIIIRGYETAGRPAKTRLHLPRLDKSYDLEFAPHEIKTVRIDTGNWTLREVNLLEE